MAKRLSDGRRKELEKAIKKYLFDRDFEATKWDVVDFIIGYEPDCTAKEAFEIVRCLLTEGLLKDEGGQENDRD